tara:strand:- start:62 stop:862 length:801 start_codon:yes stop_codon:yes gene_type:complete
MNILSIDIGIKNLAYIHTIFCKNTNKIDIISWDIINLTNNNFICCDCKNNAKYCIADTYYCNKHAKKTNYKILDSKINQLKKKSLKELISFSQKYDISFNNNLNTLDKKLSIIDFIKTNFLCTIESENTNNISLIDIGININKIFNKLFTIQFDLILIENQISPLANRMKTIQGMVAQYFINKNIENILFISSCNKLKPFINNKKSTYNERKKLSVEITCKILEKLNIDKNLIEYFKNNKKKDDLSDCFMQNISHLILNYNFSIEI